ncbi:MAG TPA: class I SAM-dependent methyltransferase [Anaerolineae bacterium]|nr:class I SAM-dependent methyltransferase [Anaerolineae bacterium]
MKVDPGSLTADKSAPQASTTSAVASGRLALRAMRRMQRFMKHISMSGVGRLSTARLEALIHHLVAQRVAALPADEALRFLFRLDAALYALQGQKAIEHDGGIHTKHRHTRYHDFFAKHVHRGDQVLDIGCGMGAVAYDLAEKAGAYVVAIDLSADNIAQARHRYAHPRVEYRLGDALQELPEGPFDVVTLSNVLEHLPDRPRFLRRVQEMARPSRFLIRVPLFERDWRVPLKRELGVEWRLDPTHHTEYTLESFTEEMAAAGVRITHQEVRWGEIWAEVVPDAS